MINVHVSTDSRIAILMTFAIYPMIIFSTKSFRFLYVWLCFMIYATTAYRVVFIKKNLKKFDWLIWQVTRHFLFFLETHSFLLLFLKKRTRRIAAQYFRRANAATFLGTGSSARSSPQAHRPQPAIGELNRQSNTAHWDTVHSWDYKWTLGVSVTLQRSRLCGILNMKLIMIAQHFPELA